MIDTLDHETLNTHGYSLLELIGKGSFAEVYKIEKEVQSRKVVHVVKIVKLKECFFTEVKTTKSLNHKNLVSYIDHFCNTRSIYIVMEYCSGGDLGQLSNKYNILPEQLLKVIFHNVIDGTNYLRTKGLTHMDIKPQNILISIKRNVTYKLCDFGSTNIITKKNQNEFRKCGTYAYMAPEKLLGYSYGCPSDLWSIGVVMYRCIFGKLDYIGAPLGQVKALLRRKKLLPLPTTVQVSEDCLEMLDSLLKFDVNERIKMSAIKEHPFYKYDELFSINEFKDARNIINDAVYYEHNWKFPKSLELYKQADVLLKQLVAPANAEKLYKFHCDDVLDHIAELTQNIDNIQNRVSSTPDSIDTLKLLALTTPKLTTGLEIALYAEDCYADGKKGIALKKLTEALNLLMGLYNAEPSGRRRNLLLIHLDKWMKMAEQLKTEFRQCDKPRL